MKHIIIKPNDYKDSFTLMLFADQAQKLPGVNGVALLMGTEANRNRLINAGYQPNEITKANSNDLIIAIDAINKKSLQTNLEEIESLLKDGGAFSGIEPSNNRLGFPRSLETAINRMSDPDLVSISIPGEYASFETRQALQNGLHVFLFSDNVPLEDEIFLKELAWNKGLLLMGPDCGTAKIGKTHLGFCNLVRDGKVGIVAASGTGAQELMTLLDRLEIGISHIIGTGGRDLNKKVGGISSIMGLKSLDNDDQTKVIVYISKPVDTEAREKLSNIANTIIKPLVICFIGEKYEGVDQNHKYILAANLDHAAHLAASLVCGETPKPPLDIKDIYEKYKQRIDVSRAILSFDQNFIRGLYSGGSLADEAALILAHLLPEVRAGSGFGKVIPINDWEKSKGNIIIDMGDDRFTQGRPHPMIDFRSRLERLWEEIHDPTVGVILLDVVLGLNAHMNPAGLLCDVITRGMAEITRYGHKIIILAHVCGTESDPQGYSNQVEQLEKAGCWVFDSNVKAAMAAACILAPKVEDIYY